jgi:hypothetical protein
MIEEANQQILLYLSKDFKVKKEILLLVSTLQIDLTRKCKAFDVIDD